MPFYLTRDPVPSADMRNVFDNAQNLDLALNDLTSSLWTDRLGRSRMSWFGLESAFSVKLSDFESRFTSQIVEQEATFDASQADKENRFQQFLNTSGYVFLGDYQDGPFQFSARNQYIRYDNQYYRLNAATDVGFTTTGTDATSFANDVTHFVLMDGDTLRQDLGSSEAGKGASLIGTSGGGNLQQIATVVTDQLITNPQIVAGDNMSVLDRIKVKGQYDINPAPQEPQAAVGITFGGQNNTGTIMLNSRGGIQTSVTVDGLITAKGLHYPYSEGMGYWHGAYQDTLVKFPIDGMADDNITYGILFSHDEKTNTPRMFAVSPQLTERVNYTDPGRYRWGGANFTAVRELAQLDAIGRSSANSYDTWFTLDSSNPNYIKFVTLTNPNSLTGANFSCMFSIGNYSADKVSTYILDVTIPSAVTALTQYDVNKYVRFTGIGNGNLYHYTDATSQTKPRIGFVQNTAAGVLDFYIQTPTHATYFGCKCLNTGNASLFDWKWRNYLGGSSLAGLSGSTPSGIIWGNTAYTGSNYRTVMLNDGSLFSVPEGYAVLRCHVNGPVGVVNAAPFKAWVSSFCYATDFDSKIANVTCSIPSLNWYITGADLATDMPWQIRLPHDLTDVESYRCVVSSTDTTNHTFMFAIKKVNTSGTLDSSNNIILTKSLSTNPVQISSVSWIDVLVKLP